MCSVDMVMRTWRESIDGYEPWCSMPLDDQSGELRRLVEELLDPSADARCPLRRRRIRCVAIRHGAFRGAQRCEDTVVLDDFTTLRHALRRVLRSLGASRATTRDIVRSLLPEWRFARNVAQKALVEARGASR